MPAFAFHRPRFLRFRRSRSRSPEPPPPAPHDDGLETGSHSSGAGSSPAETMAQMPSPQCPVALQPAHLPHPFDPRTIEHTPCSLTTSSQVPPDSHHLTLPSNQYWLQPHYQNYGTLSHAHDFTMMAPTFIDGNININTSNQFMKELVKETIPGAAFNSSARYPPPRCHPGTRSAILQRCSDFVANNNSGEKICWVVGAAGVGKSAIVQSVAESPDLPVTLQASVFFSAIGRNDATKTVTTVSYQFATRSGVYRQLIENEIARDPSLLQSSMPVQFKSLIVDPFVHHPQLNTGRVLIIVDGLDECNNPRAQQELLRLISDSCIQYPSLPIVWLIASRPEPHITSFFSRRDVIPAYMKEEIPVDSEEARADVGRYLRHELTEIKQASDSLASEWPREQDIRKLVNAASGLFAYAHTVTRYIGDPTIGNPALQLSDVLNIIDRHPITGLLQDEHPLALLDALYARILSYVPPKVVTNTRKHLLALASGWDRYIVRGGIFILLCNWLGMTHDEAYAALNHLRSVLRVPSRHAAHEENLKPFHKSFIDYISDFKRSGFSPDIQLEAQRIKTECAFRILNEAPDGVDFGDLRYIIIHGTLARGPGTGANIQLTWLGEKVRWNDNKPRLNLYKLAIAEVAAGMKRGDPTFQSDFCVKLLNTQFQSHTSAFPHFELRDLVFAAPRRDEFAQRGILKQMSPNMVDTSNVIFEVKLRFCRPHATVANLSDPWDPSCTHKREGEWEEGKDQDWVTVFWQNECASCSHRLQSQLERIKIESPDYTIPIMFTSAGLSCVEFRFVDPEDGVSEWKYSFWCRSKPKEHKMYYGAV